jgi:hypothetical protein
MQEMAFRADEARLKPMKDEQVWLMAPNDS